MREQSLLNSTSLRVALLQIYVEGNRREIFNVWKGPILQK